MNVETPVDRKCGENMLKWTNQYYVGDGIEDPEEIRNNIDKRKAPLSVHLLTLPVNSANLMEITGAVMLRQKYMYDRCPLIIGMAADKDSAIQLASQILEECYQKTGSFRVEEYLKNR